MLGVSERSEVAWGHKDSSPEVLGLKWWFLMGGAGGGRVNQKDQLIEKDTRKLIVQN